MLFFARKKCRRNSRYIVSQDLSPVNQDKFVFYIIFYLQLMLGTSLNAYSSSDNMDGFSQIDHAETKPVLYIMPSKATLVQFCYWGDLEIVKSQRERKYFTPET